MRKISALVLIACVLGAASCKKKSDDPAPTPTPTPVHVPEYYFKFKLDGVSYNLQADSPQYMYLFTNRVGGYVLPTINKSAGLGMTWLSAGDSVKESQLMALKGKTLYFNDTAVHPEISFDTALTTAMGWTSVDTNDTHFFVKITDIVFLKNAVALTTPVKTYVVTGTCSAVLQQGTSKSVLSDGEFHFIVSGR